MVIASGWSSPDPGDLMIPTTPTETATPTALRGAAVGRNQRNGADP
jgi:hypothetical protein